MKSITRISYGPPARAVRAARAVRSQPGAILALSLVALLLVLAAGVIPVAGPAPAAAAAAGTSGAATGPSTSATTDQTVELNAEIVDFDVQKGIAKLSGKDRELVNIRYGDITAAGEYIEYQQQAGIAKVERNVRLEQKGDAKLSLTADSLTADIARNITTARGKVRFVYQNVTATGGVATFFASERRLVLTDDAEVRTTENTVRAAEITVYLGDGQVERIVTKGNSRVTVNAKPGGQSSNGK